MKRCIIFLFTMLIMQSVNAIRVTIDGLNYSLITEPHEAIISYGNKCAGKLVIPSEVSYNGQTFIVKSMLWKAFFDCPELTKVEIPKTLEDVMHYYPNDPDEGDIETILISSDFMNPFVSCAALESVEVDEDNPSMKSVVGVLFSKDGTRLYAYPAGIKATSYVVPQGVEWIGRAAFANANLKKLDLPESVRTICHPTFSGCSLDEVVIRGILDEQSVNSYLFYGLNESARLYVPASEVERYKSIYTGIVLPLEEYKETEPVTYTAGQMATIILPTAPDASKGKYYRLNRCEGSDIIFEQELQPQAHIPYIIVPSEDFSIDPSTLDLAGLSNDTVSIEGVSFIGTYSREELNEPEGFYIDIIDTTPDCTPLPGEGQGVRLFVGALRAWLQVTWNDPYNQGGTKTPPMEKLQIVLKDNGTGIAGNEELRIKNEESNATVYDLNGRRTDSSLFTLRSSLKKGIYIVDGKKKAR